MKKTFALLLVLCLYMTQAWAQSDADPKVTAALAKLPASSPERLTKTMEEIAALGKPGLVEIASLLTPPGKGDNTKIEYALGGFSYAATQSNRETWRKIATEAYAEALGKVPDAYNKMFLIYQLQTVGKDESVPVLARYLNDENLSGPASRALARIGTPAAGEALLQALSKASETNKEYIIEALGIAKYPQAATALEKTATSDNLNIRKVSLYALSELAVPSSANVLAAAAQNAAYTYDEADATAVYLKYLAHLAGNGSAPLAEKAALDLLKPSVPTATRSAALKVYSDSRGQAGVPLLVQAMNSDDAEYRAAALKLGQTYLDKGTSPWVAALKKAKPQVQAEIIRMLGRAGASAALPTVLSSLKSKDTQVKLAAIWATGKLGGTSSITSLLPVLKTASPEEIQTLKSTLLTLPGADLSAQLATALPTLPAAAQPAVIEVLAARQASDRLPAVLPFLKSPNSEVKSAAFTALKSLATASDLPTLYTLLNNGGSPQEITAVQSALGQSIQGTGDISAQSRLILEQMQDSPAGKRLHYLAVLASIGGREALQSVNSAYTSGDVATKQAAIAALSTWADASAAPVLLAIGKNAKDASELDAVLTGYVTIVGKSPKTPVNKVIMLRNAMEVATTTEQKVLILGELAKYKTFNALLFAGKYLDEEPVQQAAAKAVASIALANPQFYGSEIRTLLTKASSLLTGQGSEYQQQAIQKHLADMPKGEGFVAIFNGKDLTGWKGLVENPIKRSKMHPDTLAAKQKIADVEAQKGWYAQDGDLIFTGHGNNLATTKQYGDFEMYVDWKIEPNGDAGIYLRGTPQVQIWDTSRVDVGAQVGSGGLYNNQKNPSKPTQLADNAIGDWNTFHITMVGDRVSVDLNGVNVVNNVTLENYWDRNLPIFAKEQIELQAHGTLVAYRDIYVREIPRPEPYQLTAEEKNAGYKVLFDGTNLFEWVGNKTDYFIENGDLVIDPTRGGKGNLYTKDEYSDFVYRFEFQLTPGANNGLGIRTPLEGDAAYVGTEIQILDNDADIYKNLQPYQYHGSAYGIIPAKRGYLKPVGEWNTEEVYVKGSKIKVTLNGTVIMEGDLAEASKNGTADHKEHPGLSRTSGHIGYLGHGNPLRFRNIRVLDLAKAQEVPATVPEVPSRRKKAKKKK
jgi:HEAT repeat protein